MSSALKENLHPETSSPPHVALGRGALHELYAETQGDAPILAALALMLAPAPSPAAPQRETLWVRHAFNDTETGRPCPSGLAELGFDPGRILLLRARDQASALQGALEGARCAALGSVIVEFWGEARGYDLTASRRLTLAARASGVPLFLLRAGARPAPSAAETRWLARAAPSRALAAQAPGPPAFHLSLLRARDGREGTRLLLEWNRDAGRLDSRLIAADPGRREALPRPVAALPAGRPGAARDMGLPGRLAG